MPGREVLHQQVKFQKSKRNSKRLSAGEFPKGSAGECLIERPARSKLQVSFAEYRLFYRALLQKRPSILRSLLIQATPHRKTCSQQVFDAASEKKNLKVSCI